jgi:uncharacterized protein (DUF362 family)
VRVNARTRKAAKRAIVEALDLIGYDFPERVNSVVIKPNLCYYQDYSTGYTTDPEFVAAFIELLREKNPSTEVAIVESDASAMKCRHSFRMLGYEKLRDELDVKLVNLSEDDCVSSEVTIGKSKVKLSVPRTILDSDLRVNMPKIKYMIADCKITCALKNIFGCNPYPSKFKYHSALAETIVALNKAMPFTLVLVDAFMVPGVNPRKIGLVMAGIDPVAVDAQAAVLSGFNPKKIGYLRLASREGLGRMDAETAGMSPRYFAALYPRRTPMMKLRGQLNNLIVQVGLGKKLGLE